MHPCCYIVLLLAFIFQISCVQEEVVEKLRTDEKETILYIKSSDLSTYAMNASTEIEISKIDILAFKIEGSNESFAYRREVNTFNTTSNPNKKEFIVKLIDDDSRYSYVFIANARTQLNSLTLTPGSEKETILSRLTTHFNDKWSEQTPIPMYGEIKDKTPKEMAGKTIPLTRCLTKVELVNNASNFTLKEVYIYNRYIYGRIAPQDRASGWVATYTPPFLPDASLFSPLKRQYATSDGNKNLSNLLSPYTPSASSPTEMRNIIYLHEAGLPNEENNNFRLDATCLVVGGIYDGSMNYYRVDFLYNKGNPNDPTSYSPNFYMGGNGTYNNGTDAVLYRPLLRNNQYEIKIRSVTGKGYENPDDAFESNKHNMEVYIVTWTIGKVPIEDPIYSLSVNKSELIVDTPNTVKKIKITTDYPDGWKANTSIEKLDMDFSQNGDILTITFKRPNNISNGIINISAGNLTKEIIINP